jgi:hypothetical protein
MNTPKKLTLLERRVLKLLRQVDKRVREEKVDIAITVSLSSRGKGKVPASLMWWDELLGKEPKKFLKRPSVAQRQALEDIRDHGDPLHRVRGRAQHGGWDGVMRVITRERWAWNDGTEWVMTTMGAQALAR